MKTLHTIEHTQDGLTVKATQRYHSDVNLGHYDYVVTNSAGHIIKAGQTKYGVPIGKMGTDDLKEILKGADRWLDDEDRELYGLSKEAE